MRRTQKTNILTELLVYIKNSAHYIYTISMLALVKNKRHTWKFLNSYRVPHRKVNVFECVMCKCQKYVTIDNLTHSHISTNYVQGKETTTKVPDCFTRENLLFA